MEGRWISAKSLSAILEKLLVPVCAFLMPINTFVTGCFGFLILTAWVLVIGEWQLVAIGLGLYVFRNLIGGVLFGIPHTLFWTSLIGSRRDFFSLFRKTTLLISGTIVALAVFSVLRAFIVFYIVLPIGLEGLNLLAALLFSVLFSTGFDFMVPNWTFRTPQPLRWGRFFLAGWATALGSLGDGLGYLVAIVVLFIFGDYSTAGVVYFSFLFIQAFLFIVNAYINECETILSICEFPDYVDRFGLPSFLNQESVSYIAFVRSHPDPQNPPVF